MNIEIYFLLGFVTVVVAGTGWIVKELKNMAISLDNLNAAVVDLTLAVDAVIGVIGNPGVPEVDVQLAADLIVLQTARINAALPTPPVP